MKISWLYGCKIRLVFFGFIALTISNRKIVDFTFDTPTNLDQIVNSTESEYGLNIPVDGFVLYFTSSQAGIVDLICT